MSIEKVLVVDDEMLVRTFLAETLQRKNLDVTMAENGQKALQLIKEHAYDLVITDMKMPDMTGIDVLRKIKEQAPATIVVVITAFGSIENAVEAMHLGAFNYLIKPFSPDTIEAVLEKAHEHLALIQENHYLRQQVTGSSAPITKGAIAESPVMCKLLQEVLNIAKSNANVFINGESGTGKEVIAHTIHYNSLRANRPFIKINCAAMPETLIESELFGHEKGAFTGANIKKPGRFELANGGTLLLDEVTEIPISLQAKLLRVAQEQEFERVGGTKTIKVDVRLISTSNRNPKEAIAQKILREDLYYRLNVVPIFLPPLRDRKEDIIPLALHFLHKMCQENHKEDKYLTESAKKQLLAYSWPGNVRELANLIERAVVLSAGREIGLEHLSLDGISLPSSLPSQSNKNLGDGRLPLGTTLAELEKRLIVETLEWQSHNRGKTAEILGISPRTLRHKLREYRLAGDEEK